MVPAMLGSSVLRNGAFPEGERDEPVALPDEKVPRVESITYGELGAFFQGQVDVVETLHQRARKQKVLGELGVVEVRHSTHVRIGESWGRSQYVAEERSWKMQRQACGLLVIVANLFLKIHNIMFWVLTRRTSPI